jgi:adenosine deaminase
MSSAAISSTATGAALDGFIAGMPKTELHLHIEGTLEPELMFALAQRNQVALPYASVEDLRAAYNFSDLQSFLDLYYAGANVLRTEQDFYDMTAAYIARAQADQVRHAEIFFDPQTHTERGIPIATVFRHRRCAARCAPPRWLRQRDDHVLPAPPVGRRCLRHPGGRPAAARAVCRPVAGHRPGFLRTRQPPEKFERVYARCRELGFRLVAHAGEEGPAAYVIGALDVLHVERIDHGVRSEEDPALMQRLAQQRTPLTVCPLSNLKLCVVKDMAEHNLARLLDAGLAVTVNSDDPAYFGGYMNANYHAVARSLELSRQQVLQLARNGIDACFLSDEDKAILHQELEQYAAAH